MAIQLIFLQHNITLKNRRDLKNFILTVFKKEKRKLGSLTYIFCSDEYLLKINKAHLKHNYYTDIITFDLSDTPDIITGEIYISTERVKENSQTIGVSINEELHRVIFHGALHLCGYGDKSNSQKKAMRAKENDYLKAYFK